MSGQLLLFLLTSVLAADESTMNRSADGPHAIAQSDLFGALVSEESRRRKRVSHGQQQLSESQKAMMEHVELSDNWNFWYDDAAPEEIESRSRIITSEEWLNTLKRMDVFRSYGQFLNQVKTLDNHASVPARIYLFKANVRPLWEDEANKEGGKLVICLPDEQNPLRAFEAYLKVAVKVMCSSLADRVCGITFATHPECGATISVWTPTIWTPLRDRENFNRFKRILCDDEEFGNQGPLKVIFRPHKTATSRLYAAANVQARRPYARNSRCVRPPPGFEGSAPENPLRQWFSSDIKLSTAAASEAPIPSPAQVPDEEEAEKARQKDEEVRRLELLRQQAAAEAEKREQEAKARKLARRQRQKENRKKRQQRGDQSDADPSLSDASSSSDDEDSSNEVVREEHVVPSVVRVELDQVNDEPKEAAPKSYGLFVPALAVVSACTAVAAPLLWQFVF